MLLYVIEVARVMALAGAMAAAGDEGVSVQRADEVEQRSETVEVRLRKLHLVRPDLIQYPLAFETYC